ncbi:MAG: ester cyclase [Chromatiales bacterium]
MKILLNLRSWLMRSFCAVSLSMSAWALAADPVTVVDAYMAAWNEHDAAKAAAFFAEDGEYYDASVGEPQKGRANAQEKVIQAFMTAAPDCVWTREGEPIVGHDAVAFQWTFSGTNTGACSDGTAATGKPFKFSGATLMRFHNGRIVWQGDYYDAYGFYKQLGLAQ